MTTIRNDAADRFVRAPPRDARLFLVHGNDEGLIHERAKALVDAALAGDPDPIGLSRMDAEILTREPGRLADEAYAVSMFGGRRAIWIAAGSSDLTRQIEPLLARPPLDSTVVVEAGNLRKNSPLRALFEQAGAAVSVECYSDERATLAALVDSEARAFGLRVDAEARQYLLRLLGADRLASRGEITKLMLYALGGAGVELSDVTEIVSDAAVSELDECVDRALLGNAAVVEEVAGRFFNNGGDVGYLMFRLVSRIAALHVIAAEIERGGSLEAALRARQFGLPPSGRAALSRQAENWTAAMLDKLVPSIYRVVARLRRETRLERAVATRALWAVSSGVGAQRK